MNTIEGNKLIAEFIGGITTDSKEWVNSEKKLVGRLFYHSSWEWLMPVLIKIGEYKYPDKFPDGTYDYAHLRTFGMKSDEGKYLVRINRSQLFQADKLIDAAWEAAVDFIQWYNEQQKR